MKHIGHMGMGQKDSEVQKEGTLAVKLQDGLKLEISMNHPKPVLPQAFRSEPDLSQSVPINCPFPSTRNQPIASQCCLWWDSLGPSKWNIQGEVHNPHRPSPSQSKHLSQSSNNLWESRSVNKDTKQFPCFSQALVFCLNISITRNYTSSDLVGCPPRLDIYHGLNRLHSHPMAPQMVLPSLGTVETALVGPLHLPEMIVDLEGWSV